MVGVLYINLKAFKLFLLVHVATFHLVLSFFFLIKFFEEVIVSLQYLSFIKLLLIRWIFLILIYCFVTLFLFAYLAIAFFDVAYI